MILGKIIAKLKKKERLFTFITYTLLAAILLSVCFLWRIGIAHFVNDNNKFSLDLEAIREKKLCGGDHSYSRSHDQSCRISSCLNIYRCDQSGHDRLSVYVYPFLDFVDTLNGKVAFTITREFYEVLEAILNSPFYTSNPNEACLLLPAVDLLNINLVDSELVGRALASLDHWRNGENHILINLLAGSFPPLNRSLFNINTNRAIILSGGFDIWNNYRPGFDVALPVWSPVLKNVDVSKQTMGIKRTYKLIVAQLNIVPECLHILQNLRREDNPSELLLLEQCSTSSVEMNVRCLDIEPHLTYEYPLILKRGTFCLLSRSLHIGQPDLLEMLAYGCIPVITVDSYIFPFEELIDWTLAAVRVRETDLHLVMDKLRSISETKIHELQQHGQKLYNRYFKDLRTITLTAFSLLETRIFPHLERRNTDWNTVGSTYETAINPLFLPITVPKAQGFTAVILTYDRVKSLFTLIQKLSLVPSLHSILVVWNNPEKPAPHFSTFPIIQKPLKVVRMRSNLLSNRFFPYAEIETEAILSIDDDITMLRADELDFGFEVWREFPDRIVGFPSRVHMWDNSSLRWYYDSEWTNHISMVLTGAAFHHKFWSHMYTYGMPGNIKKWVDKKMNCEDIAMNFLVAKITNKSPIKVTPRKKFKCPECTNNEMLSADLSHMLERSACVDRFAKIYGYMPLRIVEFRADPVLFKDNFPEKLKRFNDVGSL